MKKIMIFFLAALVLAGCSRFTDDLTADRLKNLITDAATGSTSANDSTGKLFGSIPAPGEPKGIFIDTISVSGMQFFAAAIQFDDPVYNRFALYDKFLNCYLVDRSLNGSLQLSGVHTAGMNYFKLEENYSTNDSISLKRISVYRGDTSGFKLAFRTFTMMKTADTVFIQNIYEISPEVIRTNVSAPVFSGLNNLNDEYFYDSQLKQYKVKKSIYFDEFVVDFINSINDTSHKFIKPVNNSKNTDVSSVFEFTDSFTPDYYLSLNEDWKELRNKPGVFLKRELSGSKYVNDKLLTNIYVFRIPFYEEAETYVDARLENEVSGNYSVRYSNDYEVGNEIKKYFEYSCRTKKFLLILSALRDTYAKNRQAYFEIINTFYINC